MKIIATYDMIKNLGSGPELVLYGQEIDPPGTAQASRDEAARHMIRRGAAMLPADFERTRAEREKKRMGVV